MSGLPDPQASRAVLVGVSRYATLEPLPAVANNLPALARALAGPVSWGLADRHCAVVAEPATAPAWLHPVRAAAGEARDTLLVYYAGHGLLDSRGELFFALPGSVPGLGYTGVTYQSLRDVIADGQAQRYVIVLDCCFSGRAMGLMGGPTGLADHAEIDGSYLLAAAPENGAALAPPGEIHTAFTAELLHVLTSGIDGGPRDIDLETVYQHLLVTLRGKSRPLPQKRDRNTAGRLILARNPAYRPAPLGTRPAPEDPRWPDPSTLTTPRAFLDALYDTRVLSGKTFRTLAAEAAPPVSPGAISALVNRTTLPKTWKTTGIFLASCGLAPPQVQRWKTAWERLRNATPEQSPSVPATGTSRQGRRQP